MAKQPFFAELSRMPWWVALIAAGLFGVIGAVFIPIMMPENLYLNTLLPAAQGFLYLVAFLCFLTAIVSAVRSWHQGRLFAEMGLGRRLETLAWEEFEAMLAGAFRAQGYLVATNKRGSDGGVDLRLRKDGKRIYVQAKHWRSWKVGVKPVRELAGVVSAAGVDHGILVSSIGFTREARAFAKQANIELIGRDTLHRWFRQHAGSRVSSSPEEPGEPPTCLRCNIPMVQRIARRGPHEGHKFWGCTNYPKCKVTRALIEEAPRDERRRSA